MKTRTLNCCTLTVIAATLAACSDDGGVVVGTPAADAFVPSIDVPAGPSVTSRSTEPDAMRDGSGLPPLAGGETAQRIADATAAETNALNGVVPGSPLPFEVENDDDFAPAPPSIGADVPVTYFGPSPSSVNENLIGPVQLLTAGTVDLEATPNLTVTLPLYEGRLASGGPRDGASIWYIVTDTTDRDAADALGLNFSGKLNFSDLPPDQVDQFMSTSVRRAFYDSAGELVVSGGAVDYAPERTVTPGSSDTSGTSNILGTVSVQPGSVGTDVGDPDGFYSPLVLIENAGGHVYNAPMISFGTSADMLAPYCDGIDESNESAARALLHDSVTAICPGDDGEPGTVTLELALGFSFGREVLYLSMDANVDVPAALEKANFAPALGNVPTGRDDSLFSAVERLFAFTNGPTNDFDESNPQRQGFNSALIGEGGPLNVLGGIPTIATDYSPLWDVNFGEWTQEAVDLGYRSRMNEEFAILGMVERGFLTGPGGTSYGSSGVIVNCPIVRRLL